MEEGTDHWKKISCKEIAKKFKIKGKVTSFTVPPRQTKETEDKYLLIRYQKDGDDKE